jgi:tRNA threonylcarbamoyladenosine biosynthesis protein TsaB
LALILHIECATLFCSVALADDGRFIAEKELKEKFRHSENLHLMIDALLKGNNYKPADLAAIALSKGPGSYTALRIGSSSAKGLVYALNIPLIAIDTLQIMAIMASREFPNRNYCPMLDAGRMEVYTGVFDESLRQISETEALIVDAASAQKFKNYPGLVFCGSGVEKCRSILMDIPDAKFLSEVYPSAKFMTTLALQKFEKKEFENAAYFEPAYLKNFLFKKKKE